MFRRFIPAILAAALAAAPAAAADPGNRTATIHFGDLDLTTLAGQDALQGRIRNAIDDICGPATDLRDLSGAHAIGSCRAELQAQADGQIKMALDVSHSRVRLTRSSPGPALR